MTDNTPPAEPTPTPVAPVPVEPVIIDPVARVEGAAAAVEKAINSIDDLDLTPEARKAVEDYASNAANKALQKQTDKGNFMTREQFDSELAKERALNEAKDVARDQMYGFLAEHGIAPGTPRYNEFAQASTDFKAEALTTQKGIAKIVATMTSTQEASRGHLNPQSGGSLQGEKQIVLEGGIAKEQVQPTLGGTNDLASRIAAHQRANTGR